MVSRIVGGDEVVTLFPRGTVTFDAETEAELVRVFGNNDHRAECGELRLLSRACSAIAISATRRTPC